MTASITMMPEVTRKIRPPRALAVPYALGFPMGEPGNRNLQLQILSRLLDLCRSREPVPVLEEFRPE